MKNFQQGFWRYACPHLHCTKITQTRLTR